MLSAGPGHNKFIQSGPDMANSPNDLCAICVTRTIPRPFSWCRQPISRLHLLGRDNMSSDVIMHLCAPGIVLHQKTFPQIEPCLNMLAVNHSAQTLQKFDLDWLSCSHLSMVHFPDFHDTYRDHYITTSFLKTPHCGAKANALIFLDSVCWRLVTWSPAFPMPLSAWLNKVFLLCHDANESFVSSQGFSPCHAYGTSLRDSYAIVLNWYYKIWIPSGLPYLKIILCRLQ